MMEKWKLILYFIQPAFATVDGTPTGEHIIFDTEKEAIEFGRKFKVMYEPVRVRTPKESK